MTIKYFINIMPVCNYIPKIDWLGNLYECGNRWHWQPTEGVTYQILSSSLAHPKRPVAAFTLLIHRFDAAVISEMVLISIIIVAGILARRIFPNLFYTCLHFGVRPTHILTISCFYSKMKYTYPDLFRLENLRSNIRLD